MGNPKIIKILIKKMLKNIRFDTVDIFEIKVILKI